MYTSLMLFALAGYLPPAIVGEKSPWLSDYGVAVRQGATERKPVAVVLGSGVLGWQKLANDGGIGNEAKTALAGYVCVYVDTAREEGQRMAKAFEMTGGPGLVISDRSGQFQAFRHEGALTNRDLIRCLAKYGDPDRVVRATETDVNQRTSLYAPQSEPVSRGWAPCRT
jgi:hypothetical protein